MYKKNKLMELLKELRLKGFLENYEEITSQENKSIDEIMLELCEIEAEKRYIDRIKRKIKQASFPKMKTLAMIDYKKAPKLPKQKIEKLATCEFINKKENVVLVGDSGGGKTHLAIALGVEACKRDYKVKFFTACQLVNILVEEYENKTIEKFMNKLKKYPLIVVDELGYIPFSQKGGELLFQVFSNRYESGSIIVTSNLHFSKWSEIFIKEAMTAALLDRLIHHATIIKYDWGSIRFNESRKKMKK